MTLALSSPTLDLSALDRARLADGTRRHYKQAMRDLQASGIDALNYDDLIYYANTLPHSGKRNLQAALKHVMKDYVNRAKTSNAPVETIQRFLWAVEVMNDTLSFDDPDPTRIPHWLSQEQIDRIANAALENSLRDYIVISLLAGAGLRCNEASNLTFDSISQIPYEDGVKNVITVIKGKGEKNRDVTIGSALFRRLMEWKEVCKGGRVARRFYKGGKLGEKLTSRRIFAMVRKYGVLLGIEDLDPHDLRRSYGRITYYANGKDIMLVMNLLGHDSPETTKKYIGLKSVLVAEVFPTGN